MKDNRQNSNKTTSFIEPRRVLVTGGAGFLGSHLCRELVARGAEVICMDNFFTGHKRNIQDLHTHPDFELIRHDIVNPIFLEVDQIYNLACPASPVHYQYNPVKTIKTSVMGTINMLGLAKRVKARMLQASTSEVYGDPQVHPQPEDYWGHVNPVGVRSCYDEGKRCAETLCFDYYRQNQVEIKVARIFNTYGPNMDLNDGRVISNFVTQALEGKPLTIYGDGNQTRSFCYIDDMVQGLIKFMETPADITGPLNLGNPEEITILTLAQKIIELSESNSQIEHQAPPPDDPARRQPEIELARSVLHWQPRVSLEMGLEKTIAYFSNLLAPYS
ncbi:MAG: SDR family oxidoreductase [Fidelibacterota bacterium]|nr:MAG: SDR family oxidoreductase [Candidatus Neomarinimicrobiota bacterium]